MAATTTTRGRHRRLAALAVAGMAVLVLSGGAGHASSTGLAAADADHYSPANTAVTGTSTGIAFVFQPLAPIFSWTCSNSRLSGRTPATGLGAFKIAAPAFNDGTGSPCRDTLGFTHTMHTSGGWKIRLIDAAGDEAATEPNAGDTLQLIIPKNGLTDTDTIGCVITLAPSVPVTVTGTYDDHNTFTVSLPALPVATSGGLSCPLPVLSTVSFAGTYTFGPGFSDAS